MALDPYRRGKDNRAPIPRAPWIIGAVGLIAMLGIVYQLSVAGFSSNTARLADWMVQTPR